MIYNSELISPVSSTTDNFDKDYFRKLNQEKQLIRLQELLQHLNAVGIQKIPNYDKVYEYIEGSRFDFTIENVMEYILKRKWLESCTNFLQTKNWHWRDFGYNSKTPYRGVKAREVYAIEHWLKENTKKGINLTDFDTIENSPPSSLHSLIEQMAKDLNTPKKFIKNKKNRQKGYSDWKQYRNSLSIQQKHQIKSQQMVDIWQSEQKNNEELKNIWIYNMQCHLQQQKNKCRIPNIVYWDTNEQRQ
ncbi:hypothetical protein BJ944DRAFT_233205 [Cunninghamella echinulata]|nr:hypothetical protein BJ944DRAFT_233205 [Cunninghamella echinulata]